MVQNYDNIKRIAITIQWHADDADSLRENADWHGSFIHNVCQAEYPEILGEVNGTRITTDNTDSFHENAD